MVKTESSSIDTGDPSCDESSSGEDPLGSGLLVDGDKDGDGSDPHGESLSGNGASSQMHMVVILSGGTPTGKEDLHQQRFEEGYDLFDPDYTLWLEQHHPEALPADRYTLTSAPSGDVPGGSASSIPLSPAHSQSLLSLRPRLRPLVARQVLPLSPAHIQSLLSLRPRLHPLVVRQVLPLSPAHIQSLLSLWLRLHPLWFGKFSLFPSSSSSMCSSNGGQSSGKQSVISQFLPPLPTVTPSRSSSSKQDGAPVLISKECLEQLAAKERKKQQKKEVYLAPFGYEWG